MKVNWKQHDETAAVCKIRLGNRSLETIAIGEKQDGKMQKKHNKVGELRIRKQGS